MRQALIAKLREALQRAGRGNVEVWLDGLEIERIIQDLEYAEWSFNQLERLDNLPQTLKKQAG